MKTSARQPLRTAPEAAERLLLAAAVSAVAADVDREEVLACLQQEGLWAKASPMEKAFLSAAQPSEKSKVHFSWQMESVYVLGWALNLLPTMTPPTTQASIGDSLERVPGPGDRVGDFVASSKLRAAAEIHSAAQAALNAHAYFRQARSSGKPEPHGYDIEVAQERHRALNWLIRYENADWDVVATDT